MILQSIRMHAVVLCCSLVLGVTQVYSVTVTTPALQRKIAGESCRFRWVITGNFTTYSIKLLSTGSSLGPNTNQTLDSVKGLITLFIWNIQTSDAGYYSLSIDAVQTNSIATLFVYNYPYSSAILAAGRNPGFQGDNIEFNCSATSYSLPVNDRPKMYYFWYTSGLGNFRNISSGLAVLQNGDGVPGYSIKNDGSTLVIASAEYFSSGWILCRVQEEGSPYRSNDNYNIYLTIYGPPDTPSNFSIQYLTHSRISLQWRCMWFNGAQQTVSVRLTDVANNVELETRTILMDTSYYNAPYSALFQRSIRPETSYAASIWSTNSFGSTDVVSLALRTPKRLILSVSSADISIVDTDATINFRISDSPTTLIRLNVTCCVEVTTECNNKSYILANTENQIVYDNLPYGTDYVFDFKVFDTDGYTYDYNLALVKGVRVSTVPILELTVITPTAYTPHGTTNHPDVYNYTSAASYDQGNPLLVPVIVLAVLLGVAVLVLLGCCIGLLVRKGRRNNSQQVSTAAHASVPKRTNVAVRESTNSYVDDNYEPVVDVDRTKNNVYYKTLDETRSNAVQPSGAWNLGQSFESGKDDVYSQNPYMNPDEIYYKKANETLDRPKKSRYQ